MPALLGYLIAVAVLLGGGYAGLEWLGSPDEPATYQHSKATTPVANKHAEPKKIVPATDAVTKAENAASGTTARAGNAGHDEAKVAETKVTDATEEKVKAPGAGAVPTGGCMPIGLTAGGQMVFTLQCRDLLEAKRGAVASSVPEQNAPAPSEDAAHGSKQSDATSGNVPVAASHDEAPSTKRTPASEPAPAGNDADGNGLASTKTLSPEESAQKEVAQKDLEQKQPGQPASGDTAPPANGMKATAVRQFSAEIKTQKPEKPKSTPDRSRLVKMTLLTIEFPDGHREQRLVPYRRFRNSMARDDD
jgi:hypothetical protein